MDDSRDSPEEDEAGQERRRPRVVDKRVSARPAGTPEQTPAPREETSPPQPESPAPETSAHREPEQVWTPEQEAEAQRLAEEIGRVPAADWVLSTVMTLVNVASVKLEKGDAEGSQLAIDALAGILDSVGSRLGPNEGPLRQVLAQLKMAYAEAVMPEPGP